MALFSAIALVVAAVAGGAQVVEARKARKAQKRAIATEQRKQDISQQREQRRLIAEARRKRAAAQQAAINQGVGEGSGVAGAVGATASQLGEGIGFLGTQQTFNRQIGAFRQQAADASARGATFGAISNLALAAAPVLAETPVPTGGNVGQVPTTPTQVPTTPTPIGDIFSAPRNTSAKSIFN